MTVKNQKRKRTLKKLWKKPWFKFIVYFFGLLLAIAFCFIPTYEDKWYSTVLSFLRDKLSFSVFIGMIVSLIYSVIVSYSQKKEEESYKTEFDQRKIIRKYDGHKRVGVPTNQNYYNNVGSFMELHHLNQSGKEKLRPEEKDIYSSDYKKQMDEIKHFSQENPYLLIPSIDIYCNVKQNTKLKCIDHTEIHELPTFVVQSSLSLLQAHKHSKKSNSETIRLDNCYFNGEKELTLETSRSTYYHMLVTNRCMDYKLTDGMTIRDIYEFHSFISPLSISKLGNQIGINGLIITKDNYLLIEHRSLQKTTWKDKFAQPISLALKFDDLFSKEDQEKIDIKLTDNNIEEKILNVLRKTIKNNFSMIEGIDYEKLEFSKVFMGLARDLLEGGKPNMYFIVKSNDTAVELTRKIQRYSSYVEKDKNCEERVPLKESKLNNQFYFIPYSDIRLTFDYEFTMKKESTIVLKRDFAPRNPKASSNTDEITHLKKNMKKECGQALLCSLSYLEILEPVIMKKEKQA